MSDPVMDLETVQDVLRVQRNRMRDFLAEYVARQGDFLGTSQEVRAAIRKAYLAAHADEAQQSFEALIEILGAEQYSAFLHQGRSRAMGTAAASTAPVVEPFAAPQGSPNWGWPAPGAPGAPPPPASPAPFAPPRARDSQLIDQMEADVRRRTAVVDGWYVGTAAGQKNVRFLEPRDRAYAYGIYTQQLVGLDVMRDVIDHLDQEAGPERLIGEALSDERIMQVKDTRVRVVLAKHEELARRRREERGGRA
jgi:hypothetical protein